MKSKNELFIGTLRIVALIITLYLLFNISPILGPNIYEKFSKRSFSSRHWKNLKYTESGARTEMVDSLLDNYTLVGMQKTEIVKLLGKPTETNYFKEFDMVYWLGPERGFISIDSEWLVIKL